MIYLKTFQNHSEYEQYVAEHELLPNVSMCINEEDIHYTPVPDIFNGYEHVDLDLPSGTMWAKCNLGADTETELGLYFQWADSQGYKTTEIGNATGKKPFNWSDYKYGDASSGSSGLTKYNATDEKLVLDDEDDAVIQIMGGIWHSPSAEQYNELLNTEYVTNQWVTDYNGSGVNGYLFTSVSNGKTLFMPSGGIATAGDRYSVGSQGHYWSKVVYSNNLMFADSLYFDSGSIIFNNRQRSNGLLIRGVAEYE